MKITIVSILLSLLLLTGCSSSYKQDPIKLCDGVIVAKDSWRETVTVAYTYDKKYYVVPFNVGDDDNLFSILHYNEKVKVYAWDDNVDGIEK